MRNRKEKGKKKIEKGGGRLCRLKKGIGKGTAGTGNGCVSNLRERIGETGNGSDKVMWKWLK